MFLNGCALFAPAETPPPPACAPHVLADIERAYVTEALATCTREGARTPEDCKAFPAIRERYRLMRAAYVECSPQTEVKP